MRSGLRGMRAVLVMGLVAAVVVSACVEDSPPAAPSPVTELVSLAATEGTSDIHAAAGVDMTPDGRYVAFVSIGMIGVNSDPDDPESVIYVEDGPPGVYVRDTSTGTVERVADGSASTGPGIFSAGVPVVSISDDGNVVAFSSTADGLVPDDDNGIEDVFVADRSAGTIERVSVASDGTEADGVSRFPSISADGRLVAFSSKATNLVAGSPAVVSAVYVHDRSSGVTSMVSVHSDGTPIGLNSSLPAISGDGSTVAFMAEGVSGFDGHAGFEVDFGDGPVTPASGVFVHELATGVTLPVSLDVSAGSLNQLAILEMFTDRPAISRDARFVVFPMRVLQVDGSLVANRIFLRDREAGATHMVSPAGDGRGQWASFPSVSDDGRYVAFISDRHSEVPGLPSRTEDVYRHDRVGGSTIRVSVPAPGRGENTIAYSSLQTAISADGRYVAYMTSADNQVPNGTDPTLPNVFRRGPLG